MLQYQSTKIFLQKVRFQIGLKKFLLSKNLKILCHWHMLLVILKKLFERFTEKNQKEFRTEKSFERKSYKLHVKWKGYNSTFNS